VGPRSREVLARMTDADVSNAAFPFMHMQRLSIGGARVMAVRVSYAGELGWELYVPPEVAREVIGRIWAAGTDLGIRCAGYNALGSLRMEKAYRSWGRELLPSTSPAMAGLMFAVDFSKDFIGAEALTAETKAGPARRLVQFAVETGDGWLHGDEPIYRDGVLAGLVTSAAYGHTVQKMLAFGYVPVAPGEGPEALFTGNYQIDISGKRCSATPLRRPLYDPGGQRLRS